MGKFSLRRYETQARVSVLLSLVSILPLLALMVFILLQMDFKEFILIYGTKRKLAIMGSALAAFGLSACGFGFGLNSAGQRRNDQPKLSWMGFFIGAAVLSLTAVLMFLFITRGEAVIQVKGL